MMILICLVLVREGGGAGAGGELWCWVGGRWGCSGVAREIVMDAPKHTSHTLDVLFTVPQG